MENAKQNIRKYLAANKAPRLVAGNRMIWPGKNHFALSSLKRIRIVLRLEDEVDPNKGQMSIIIHSKRDFGDASNAEMMSIATRQIPGFVQRSVKGRKQLTEFGIVGKVYLPSQYSWKSLNAATLKAILDLYNVVSGTLFNAGFYK